MKDNRYSLEVFHPQGFHALVWQRFADNPNHFGVRRGGGGRKYKVYFRFNLLSAFTAAMRPR